MLIMTAKNTSRATKQKSPPSKPASAYDWKTILPKYEQSHLTQKAFCEQQGLNYNQFTHQLQRKRRGLPPYAPVFAKIALQPNAARRQPDDVNNITPSDMRLTWPDGKTLHVPVGSDPKLLSTLVSAVEGAPC